MALRIIRRLLDLLDVNADSIADGETLVWDDATSKFIPGTGGGGGGGAPTDATYLVATADGTLSAEVVVGAAPGGELGGTWASPTVDATHSGSSHAGVQAAAEATAAAALATHEADTTSVHGIADTSALALTANVPSNATFNDHSARHEDGGADEISIAGLSGTSAALQAHLDDTSDAHDASAISSVAAGNLAATDVQAALNELDTEKAAASHAHAGEDITSGTVADARIAATITRDSEWQARSLTAGSGLSGGGDLSADRTFAVNVDDSTVEINSDTVRVKAGGITASHVASDVATQAELDAHLNDTSDAHDATAISFAPAGTIAATTVQAAIEEVASEAGGGGAPADVDYLVGTASGGLSAEIVVGTSPGGELGGTWASPTVDASHSGSTHAAVQAAAEATAAAALSAHTGDTSDAHDASAISILDTAGYYASADVEAALVEIAAGVPVWTTVEKGSDESVTSSTTVQTDDALQFATVSGALYEIEILLIYGSPAGAGTPDLKFVLGEDNTIRGTCSIHFVNTTDSFTTSTLNMGRTTTSTAGTAAADRLIKMVGVFFGNGGTFAVLWSQNTSDANATIMRAGSLIRYRRVA